MNLLVKLKFLKIVLQYQKHIHLLHRLHHLNRHHLHLLVHLNLKVQSKNKKIVLILVLVDAKNLV